MTRRLSLIFVAVSVIAALAGCGGGTKQVTATSSRSTGDAVSPPQLIARADAICQRLNVQFAAHKPASQAIAEIARVAPRRAIAEQRVVTELSDLTVPASVARAWRAIIADRRGLAAQLAQIGRDASNGNAAGVRALSASKERLHNDLQATAERAGFTSCSQVG
jgi:hypothetical protein